MLAGWRLHQKHAVNGGVTISQYIRGEYGWRVAGGGWLTGITKTWLIAVASPMKRVEIREQRS